MISCNMHEVCQKGFVQGPDDLTRIMNCMIGRGIIRKIDGPGYSWYVTPRTHLHK